MKKFIAKLALALLPAALYLAVFVAFEPNNYFGLRGVTSGNAPSPGLRAYQLDPQPNLLLGDSRMAHFDMALVDEVVRARPGPTSPMGAPAWRRASTSSIICTKPRRRSSGWCWDSPFTP